MSVFQHSAKSSKNKYGLTVSDQLLKFTPVDSIRNERVPAKAGTKVAEVGNQIM